MKLCFVISPIGTASSETRKRSDGFLREVIKPVAEEFGYYVERADEDKSPGVVTDRIIGKVIDADLVIADLHGHNPNVMYEVAIRHATDKPLVQMAEEGELLPFDIGNLSTVFYDPSVAGLQKWRADLRQAIEGSHRVTGGSNPVVRAGLMRTLQSQSGTDGSALAELLDEMQNLKHQVRESRLSGTGRLSGESRVLLLPEQFMQAGISMFLDRSPSVPRRNYIVQVRDNHITVSTFRLPAGGKPDVFKYSFKCEPDAKISQELERIERQLVIDMKLAAEENEVNGAGHEI
jgi:hypothetical protein